MTGFTKSSIVLGAIVDSTIMVFPFSKNDKILSNARITSEMSHDRYWSSLFGVGTAMIKTSDASGVVDTFNFPDDSTSS